MGLCWVFEISCNENIRGNNNISEYLEATNSIIQSLQGFLIFLIYTFKKHRIDIIKGALFSTVDLTSFARRSSFGLSSLPLHHKNDRNAIPLNNLKPLADSPTIQSAHTEVTTYTQHSTTNGCIVTEDNLSNNNNTGLALSINVSDSPTRFPRPGVVRRQLSDTALLHVEKGNV